MYLPNNGYNDFFLYLDKLPTAGQDKQKSTIRDITLASIKTRRRDHLIQERRQFLLSQVQYALDSSERSPRYREREEVEIMENLLSDEQSIEKDIANETLKDEQHRLESKEEIQLLEEFHHEAKKVKDVAAEGTPARNASMHVSEREGSVRLQNADRTFVKQVRTTTDGSDQV